jgi:hypothetical protein
MSALFDFNDRVTVAGTLSKLDWRNPHIYVFVDGKTAAAQPQVQAWSIRGAVPGLLPPAEHQQGRCRSLHWEDRHGRGQPRARRLQHGASPRPDDAGRQGRLGLPAKLLISCSATRGGSHEDRLAHHRGGGGCVAVAAPAHAQGLPRDPAERAKAIAQILEANARQLTLFDRQGQSVGVVGPRDLFQQPVLSPDGKRVAVIKADLDKETNDLWVIDVASARGTQITTSKMREGVNAPAWSPDSNQVAYVALRDGYFGVYRKGLGPQGQEELLLKNSAPLTLTDWSQDGRYLSYFSTDLGAGRCSCCPQRARRAQADRGAAATSSSCRGRGSRPTAG